MRLAYIKLAGFKSFVDPTQISVSQDLVGIVGPNGCGKSNIIDALRWVLGESKASALRGDSMQDVIFAGSDHRKAVGRASVEIVFDNHLNKATGQWSSYSEISIKRVLQRDGISSYYINNLQVRRRDVSEIFLGTGVGGRGYAIIEQGMISRVIEAKPQELRNFLEEAAGISQYRERRQETYSHLMETRKNLIRLEDISQTLETQLQHLQAQAEIAQHYRSLQEKLHLLQSLLWVQRRNDALSQRTNAEQEIQKLEVALEAALSKQHHAEKEYETMRETEYAVSDKLLQVQGQLYTVNAEIGRLKQEINHLKNNSERLVQQIQEIEHRLEKNNRQEEIAQKNLLHWRQEKINAESAHAESALRNDQFSKELPITEANFIRCQEALEKCRHSLLMTEQVNQLENNHLAHAAKNIQQLEARHSRLLKEQSELVASDSSLLAERQLEMDQAECALKEHSLKHQDSEHRLSAAILHKQQVTDKVQELQHSLSQATARFSALQNLQQKLENNQDLAIWLNKHQLDGLPRLWQHMQIQPEWENALEAVLRERLNSIEVAQLTATQNWLDELPTGKWAVFEKIQPADPMNEQQLTSHPVGCKKLLTYLTVNQPEMQGILNDWLCHVYVIENIQEGFVKKSLLNAGEMLVTPQGHMITRTSLTFYAPDSQLHGVLSRQQELKNIQITIDRLESQLHHQRGLLDEAKKQNVHLSNEIQQSFERGKQIQQRRHELQLETVRLSQINERTIYRNHQIDSELTEIKQALSNEISLQKSAQTKLIKNSEHIDTLKELTQQAQLAWETANHSLINQRQSLQQAAKQMQEAAFHVTTCSNKINEIEQSIQSIHEDLRVLTENLINLHKEKNDLDETPLNNLLEAAQTQRKSIEQTIVQVRQEVEDTARYLREIENTRLASEQKTYSLRDTINQIRLKEQAADITINQFDELISNAKVDTASFLPLLGTKSIAVLQSEINRLSADVAALGSVNLAALEELEMARTRQSDLLSQLQDLNEAIATLENVIQQIDRETQLRLQETFDQVNKYLGEIFPVIFAGGQARLELSDSKILEAGLLLMAQPPGKKNNSIHLLSGGEKALTALALIFSLFRLNPAPFCLLDEVDAPLDDSNTNRFCELVKSMSKQTQFLFISHNKITMEMAQQLIGVTMQEQGVSRIVAVDIADAIKMGKRIKQPVV